MTTLLGADDAAPGEQAMKQLISLCDRESDVYKYLHYKCSAGATFGDTRQCEPSHHRAHTAAVCDVGRIG